MDNATLLKCHNCGADFDAALAACPYCGAINEPGANADFFRRLEEVRSDMDSLDSAGAVIADATRETRKVVRIIVIAAIIAGAVIGGIALCSYFLVKDSTEYLKDQYYWEQENFPILEQYYEDGQYEALLEAYRNAGDSGRSVWNWNHYTFCGLLDDADIIMDLIPLTDMTDKYESALLLCAELEFLFQYEDGAGLDSKEMGILEAYVTPVRSDYNDRFGLLDEQYGQLYAKWTEDGWLSVTDCEPYVEDVPAEDAS